MHTNNSSPHQGLVGRVFSQDHHHITCLAAHGDSLLVLISNQEGHPINYVVCHTPVLENDKLSWCAGEYFSIFNYQCKDPMAAAFSDAANALLNPSIVEFHFCRPDNVDEDVSFFVKVQPELDPDDKDSIEDCISSYIEDVPCWSFDQLVKNVMDSFPTYTYEILRPSHTFCI